MVVKWFMGNHRVNQERLQVDNNENEKNKFQGAFTDVGLRSLAFLVGEDQNANMIRLTIGHAVVPSQHLARSPH